MGVRRTWTNRRGGVAAAALAAVLAACGGGGEEPAQTAQGGAPGRGPGMGGGGRVSVVEVQPVARGSIARQVTVSGIVEPVRSIGVNSQLGGAVTQVLVQEGDRVRRGAVLARMDARELVSQLAAAEASLEVAKAAYERAEQLRERRVITLPEYERERTAFAAATAQVDQLRTRVGFATVRSPVDGVVTEKNVESGDVVGTNARLFSVADVSELVARVGVSELDVVELSSGDRVGVTLDAFPNRTLNARIRRVFPVADPQTRLVPVEIVFDRENAQLARPGFLARVTFDLATSDNVLLLPVGAVLGGQGAQSVFIVENGVATRRTVTTGLTSQGRIEILSGLSEGEGVIVIGHSNLRDGMTVRVAGQDTPGAPLPASAGAQDTQPQQASPSGQPGTGGPQSAAQQPAPEPDAVAQPVSETGRRGL
jgi:membrane fusion protein, multidrug efflux system